MGLRSGSGRLSEDHAGRVGAAQAEGSVREVHRVSGVQALRGRGASPTLRITLHGRRGGLGARPRLGRSAGQGRKAPSAVREFELPLQYRREAPGDVKWSADAIGWVSPWRP